MAELENKKLQTLLRNHPDESESFYADKLGISKTKIGPLIWFNEPIALPKLKMKLNKGDIVKARKAGIRWERIAARTGESIAKCREVGGKEAAEIYTGRGRPPGGSNGAGNKAASGRRQSAAKSGKGTSGRRQSGSGNKGKTGGNKPRARTRADRLAKSGSPK